jgi:GT2 family glycosyltransferase
MKSCVLLLNWNGWKDTLECLESVLRLNASEFRVVVCDNCSANGSLGKIKDWARGELQAESVNPQLSRLSAPPFPKPIPYVELTREQAESGTIYSTAKLILIQNGENLGFAAGNNVGLRYALGDPDCEYFWILNNDTVVESDSLSAMVRLMQSRPGIGLCGSLNLSYYNPKQVQAEGGKPYCSWTARVHTPPLRMADEMDSHAASMDFVIGASMLASRAFLENVGLMEESYFLYFEELDWAMRAKGKFELGYALESVIYHKEGATIGSNSDRMKRSLLSEQFLTRSRVLFTKRFFPWALPSVLVTVCLAAGYRALRGDLERAKLMLKSMLLGLEITALGARNR